MLGIDASNEMITLAKETYANHANNLDFEQRLADNYHGEALYTVITSFSYLHWVKDIQAALTNVYTSLKPEGHFLALTYLLTLRTDACLITRL